MAQILTYIKENKSKGKTSLAVLIDPDKYSDQSRLIKTVTLCNDNGVDLIFLGGSLLLSNDFDAFVKEVKSLTHIPVILFPGSPSQVSEHADGILFLSLISGRNPELLIGSHVIAAPSLAKMDVEILPTGYMLIDCGNTTTAHYISQTSPIPYEKKDIAYATAMAGQMLGLSCIYMDGGSGAKNTVSGDMISMVSQHIDIPLIIGGGIKTIDDVERVCDAGADVVVIGNIIEENPNLIQDFSIAVHRSRVR